MWEVKQNLEMWQCKILDILYENEKIYSIIFTDEDDFIIGLIVAPHDNYKNFLIRAEVCKNFDRWDNSSYEKEYDYEHFYSENYNLLKLYKELLYCYI